MQSEVLAAPLPANDTGPLDPPAIPAGSPEDAVFVASASSDLQDLVDVPCRALEVEYKSWRNLDHLEDQAELARDIAAIANHGGGAIIFGFHEHSLLPDDTDPFRTNCTQDRVTALAQAYLDPPVRCRVFSLTSAAGTSHPVIQVDRHGATPVCIRRDGPLVDGVRLVERGACYLRSYASLVGGVYVGVPRPQSAKIDNAQDWAPLIRRCVRQDRQTLLGIIDASIEGRQPSPDTAQQLATWHRAAHTAFQTLVPRSPVAASLARRHYALSYSLDLLRPEMLDHAQLPERLRRTVSVVQEQFRSGWNMFDPPYRRAVQARFMLDPASGEHEIDFLETAWLRARDPGDTADFWRVSPRGLATIIRGYAEDMTQSPHAAPLRPGQYLSPEVLTQEVAELVCHARAFAQLFASARRVVFRCEWWGLAGRELHDPDRQWPHHGPALGDHCIATLQVPLARLTHAWSEAVAQLIAPALRMVEPEVRLDDRWVKAQAPRWAAPAV